MTERWVTSRAAVYSRPAVGVAGPVRLDRYPGLVVRAVTGDPRFQRAARDRARAAGRPDRSARRDAAPRVVPAAGARLSAGPARISVRSSPAAVGSHRPLPTLPTQGVGWYTVHVTDFFATVTVVSTASCPPPRDTHPTNPIHLVTPSPHHQSVTTPSPLRLPSPRHLRRPFQSRRRPVRLLGAPTRAELRAVISGSVHADIHTHSRPAEGRTEVMPAVCWARTACTDSQQLASSHTRPADLPRPAGRRSRSRARRTDIGRPRRVLATRGPDVRHSMDNARH